METAKAVVPLLKGAVYRAQDGKLGLPLEMRLESLEDSLLRHGRRWEAAIIGSAILIGGLIWLSVGRTPEWPGWAMLVAGAAWVFAARIT
jgi:hypothetical protein